MSSNIDGNVAITFVDDKLAVYQFEDIKTHGWVEEHISIHGEVKGGGPTVYMVWFDHGRISFPVERIHSINITYNSENSNDTDNGVTQIINPGPF